MKYYEYTSPQNLATFWENIKEYYSSDVITDTPIHIGDNTVVTTRSLDLLDDHIASTLFVKNYVADALISGGLSAIPVLDVKVNGESVILRQVAEVDIPITSISVDGEILNPYNRHINIPRLIKDVRANGESIIKGGIVDIPLQNIEINGHQLEVEDFKASLTLKRNGELIEYDDGINIIIPTQPSDIGAVSQEQLDQTNLALQNLSQNLEAANSSIDQNSSNIVSLYSSISQQNAQINSLEESLASDVQNLSDLKSSIGQPLGLAQLDSEGKIDSSYIPNLPIASYESSSSLPQPGQVGFLYITLDDNKVWIWKGELYEELGGIDASLREQVSNHLKDEENPHKVTKAQVGLDQVDNTADIDKPLSIAMSNALAEKLGITEIVNNLTSARTDKALSAAQGSVLFSEINNVRSTIKGIGNPLEFRGTVDAFEDLPESASSGDVYQVKDGDTYAWSGAEWVTISVAVTDITQYIATADEVYDIIDSYVEEE